jgi:uncharacterized protein YciI
MMNQILRAGGFFELLESSNLEPKELLMDFSVIHWLGSSLSISCSSMPSGAPGASLRKGEGMVYDDNQAWEDVRTHLPNMTIYYLFLLKKGPSWSPEETPDTNALQDAHLANLRRLGAMGKLVLNGPLLDSFATSGEIRGIGVLKANSLQEAQELISTDPMVKVGRLIFELHAWMVDKNILP